jgi:hypothetical protein
VLRDQTSKLCVTTNDMPVVYVLAATLSLELLSLIGASGEQSAALRYLTPQTAAYLIMTVILLGPAAVERDHEWALLVPGWPSTIYDEADQFVPLLTSEQVTGRL